LTTIGNHPPVGLTGSGLLELVCELRRVNVIEPSGRMAAGHPIFGSRISKDEEGVRRLLITDKGVDLSEEGDEIPLYLTQRDVRELQKAKAAIRAAMDILMARLGLQASDLQRMILTGSFGSQLNVKAVVGLGMIPPVNVDIVEPSANGAGFGAALFLNDDEFARGERIAAMAEQVDLDMDADFNKRYIDALSLSEKQRE
ncbi:MAG: ASKHA domain-containing protein, partial [Chloroflexota bacterium]|nr:ASKHA domain-containing protein [Chloroflexota bacterium]